MIGFAKQFIISINDKWLTQLLFDEMIIRVAPYCVITVLYFNIKGYLLSLVITFCINSTLHTHKG